MTAPKFFLVHDPAKPRASKGTPRPAVRRVADVSTSRRTSPVRVGLWDLGAWLGGINRGLVKQFNAAQKAFAFFEVIAAVPVGLTSSSQRVVEWFTEDIVQDLTDQQRGDIAENVIANEFFTVADAVRQDLGLDYLVGITPSMVAGVETTGDVYWNHFSTFEGRIILASTYDLRDFSREAGVRFELFLAGIIVAQILVAKFYPKLDFHEDTGCLFDYRADRSSIVEDVRHIAIEKECLDAMGPRFRRAAQSLVGVLHRLGEAQ